MTVVVAAAVVERDGRFLVTRRPDGTHLEGLWEFPGGKCEPDEPLDVCLARELREELAADVIVGRRLLRTSHEYPDRIVELHFFACHLAGEPEPALGQEVRWITRDEMRTLPFPPADREVIEMLTERL